MKQKSTILSLCLAFLLAAVCLFAFTNRAEAATVVETGACGEKLTWTLDEDGTLTISGTGTMTDCATASEAPWYSLRAQIKAVVIEDGVITIGDRAFYNCTALTEVTIGKDVQTIGAYAFRGGTAISTVTVPASVTEIKGSAFRACTALTTVMFEGNAPIMGDYIFNDVAASLTVQHYEGATGYDVAPWTEYTLSAQHVGQWIDAVKATCTVKGSKYIDCTYCKKRITLTIPYAHNYVNGICSLCGDLEVVATGICGENVRYTLYKTGLLEMSGTGSMSNYSYENAPWYAWRSDIKMVTVASGVTSIGERAFSGCSGLTSITIPDNVTSIGDFAFYDCSELRNVFFKGTTDRTSQISIGSYNWSLRSAKWHYEVVAGSISDQAVYWCDTCGVYYYLDGSIVPLQSLELLQLPDQQNVLINGSVSLDGISLRGTYEDGKTIIVNSPDNISVSADLSTVGRTTATVTVYGASTQFDVFVHEAATLLLDSSLYPESSHNYGNNANETKTFTYPGACSLTITFSNLTSVESGCDYIYIYDGNGTQLAKYTGTAAANQTLTIRGDTFKVKLTSDGFSTRYGYAFSGIAAMGFKHPPVVDEATATCTQAGLTEGSHCEICGEILVAQEETDALGHRYAASFSWSDDHKACTATLTCTRNCGDVLAVDCAVTVNEPNQVQTVHTAVAEYAGQTFTDVLTCDKFLVTFINWDGTQISSNYYHVGDKVTIPVNPTREADDVCIYAFAGWDNEVVNCAGNATYTATYESNYIDYTVVFKNWDGTILSSKTYHWGDAVTVPEDPTREADELYKYTFIGWDKEIVSCAGDATYTAQYEAVKKLNGWVSENGKWYYYRNGAKTTGWLQDGGVWYYMDGQGVMQTGWKQIGGIWYYFNTSGAMVTGWQQIGGTWYYFKSSGAMVTGWLQLGSTWYYFNASGAMVTGTVTIGGKVNKFDASGAWLGEVSQNGWVQEGGKWYYYQNGAKATGWKQISGKWYYFNTSGVMQTGWLQVGGTWYYFRSSGAMQTGWLKAGNIWYYFHSSGAMATGSVNLGGKLYRFNAAGACLNP